MRERESCALIPALHPLCIFLSCPEISTPASQAVSLPFALVLLPVLLPPAPTLEPCYLLMLPMYMLPGKKCITCPLAGAESYGTAVFYTAYTILPLRNCTSVYCSLTFEKHQDI